MKKNKIWNEKTMVIEKNKIFVIKIEGEKLFRISYDANKILKIEMLQILNNFTNENFKFMGKNYSYSFKMNTIEINLAMNMNEKEKRNNMKLEFFKDKSYYIEFKVLNEMEIINHVKKTSEKCILQGGKGEFQMKKPLGGRGGGKVFDGGNVVLKLLPNFGEKKIDIEREVYLCKVLGEIGVSPKLKDYFQCSDYDVLVFEKLEFNIS